MTVALHGRLLPPVGLSLALALSLTVAGSPASSQALFTDAQVVGANAFTTGIWGMFLHNNPTPPVGNTASQATLPLTIAAPTAATLFNYDTDRDSDPGLMIREGRYQAWLTSPLGADTDIDGDVVVTLWSAMEDFQSGIRGVVTLYLLDVNGGNITFIDSTTTNQANWQGGSATWVEKIITISGVSHTVPAGHTLGLVVFVETSSANDMWFAYDTTAYPSRMELR